MSKRLLLGWLAAPVILLGFSGCAPPVYFARSIRGRVVDAETQQSIEGVVVVAEWVLLTSVGGFGGHDKRLTIVETVTDPNGAYIIPSWGPRLRPPFSMLDYLDPKLIVFRSGYVPLVLDNLQEGEQWMIRSSQWDGETLQLAPFRGDPKERVDQLDRILTGHRGPTPKFYNELLKERLSVGKAGENLFRFVDDRLERGL
ncbi:MAG: hypothetical protein HYR72_12540 [Deltaproteobacteria bacterium]|nr:hypothetical protein [Deltaproteobacteria bacterium]